MPSLGVYVPRCSTWTIPAAFAEVVRAAAEVLDRTRPEFVFLGISFPKQQLLALALIDHLRRQGRQLPLFLCIGGALELHVGRHRRAPRWVQRAGGEWFFRFLLEPRRLFRRYFVRTCGSCRSCASSSAPPASWGSCDHSGSGWSAPGWLWMLIPLLSF